MKSLIACCGMALAAGAASAQTGVLDQVSPILFDPATHWARFYFPGAESMWRQEVRVGVAGQLEGVRLGLIGAAGTESATLRVRWGPASSPGLVLGTASATKTVPGDEVRFVDLTGQNINLVPGDLIVLELQRETTGLALAGSFMAPPAGALYPQPLYNGSSIFQPGWRIGFQTFMLEECRADLTRTATPGTLGYGIPNGKVNSEDFFYYLAQYAAGNLNVADMTTTAVPGSVGYAVPNGVLNSEDFFFYLAIHAAGC